MKIQSQYTNFTPSSWLERTYKNHTIMLVIMMSPSISDTQLKMATTYRKEEKYKHQETKGKKHLKGPELGELGIELPHISNRNGTSCFCF